MVVQKEGDIGVRRNTTFETGHAMNRMGKDGSSENLVCFHFRLQASPKCLVCGRVQLWQKTPPALRHSAPSLLSLP